MPNTFLLQWVLFSKRLPVDRRSVITMDTDGYMSTVMSWDDVYYKKGENLKWAYLPITKWFDK